MLKYFINIFSNKNDPIKHCELYHTEGYSHVDGFLCDFPDCSMNLEFVGVKKIYDTLCPVCGYYCLGKDGRGCIDKPTLINKESAGGRK